MTSPKDNEVQTEKSIGEAKSKLVEALLSLGVEEERIMILKQLDLLLKDDNKSIFSDS